MARSATARAAWKRPGSPIGRKGARKAHPRYTRNNAKSWSDADVRQLRTLAKANTPTRVIGLKLGRSETAVRSLAQRKHISLKPTNQSPYNRRRRGR